MDKVEITPTFCVFASCLLLMLPFRWLFAAVSAAAVHELCHVGAVRLCGGRIFGVRLWIGGAELETDSLPLWREILCTLAGPVGSLSLLHFRVCFPEAAVCGLLQGSYNLLPFYPLDGGRVLHCLTQLIIPNKKWAERTETGIVLVFAFGISLLFLRYGLFLPILILAACLITGGITRKIACKSSRLALQ